MIITEPTLQNVCYTFVILKNYIDYGEVSNSQ